MPTEFWQVVFFNNAQNGKTPSNPLYVRMISIHCAALWLICHSNEMI